MFFTEVRRWWVINRLHRFFVQKGGIVWADEEEFITFLKGYLVDIWAKGNPYRPVKRPFSWIFEAPDDRVIDAKVRNVIDECYQPDDQINTIKRDLVHNRPHLRLTGAGAHQFSWTYLAFGHYYARAIWTGLMVGLLLMLANYLLVKPQNDTPSNNFFYFNSPPNPLH